jgi:hypothetical protein
MSKEPKIMPSTIKFGVMSPKPSEQLSGVLPIDKLRIIDRHTMAILRLKIHGLLTDSEAKKAFRRLVAHIAREYKAWNTRKGQKT